MRMPTAASLLDAWEQGRGQPQVARALALLAAASAAESSDALADLPVGARDGRLLALRERVFGPRLEALARCPACGEHLDLIFAVADVRAPDPPDGELCLTTGGHELRFRLPTSRDLLAVAADGPSDPRGRLLTRCLVEARRGEEPRAAADLPAEVVNAVAEHMARADPQADVRLALACPACGHAWEEVFDIVSYLWAELEAWAVRLLCDVHTLACAYGWRETDILALSSWRRQRYLDLIRR
jgi:hypothetical protein